jgi:hypothetical protein
MTNRQEVNLLTVRFAQLQDDIGLGLSLSLRVAGMGRDLVDVDDESRHGTSICWWQQV